jgi:hypothetical protein
VITLENPNSRQQSFESGSIEAQMLAQTETSSKRGWSGSKNGYLAEPRSSASSVNPSAANELRIFLFAGESGSRSG